MSEATFWLLYLACACLTAAVLINILNRYWHVVERELGITMSQMIIRLLLDSLVWPLVWLYWCVVFFRVGRRP
jgi:hypothetical protein